MKLLVVDDAIVARKMIQRHLTGSLYARATLLEASSAEKALEMFDTEVSVVMSDWNMPGMDGLEFVQHLREMEISWGRGPEQQVPVIMITTEGTAQKVNLAKESGVNEYIVKPFSSDQLIQTLNRVVEIDR